MAGDWIKMRVDLPDDPAVFGIATALKIGEDAVVGKLHRLWCWADRHTISGFAPNITSKWVDRFVDTKGFADAMANQGWLTFSQEGVTFPKFDKHNGHTAKERAEAAERQRLSRESRDTPKATAKRKAVTPTPEPVTNMSQEKCDKSVTREEKSREEQEPSSKANLGDVPPPVVPPAALVVVPPPTAAVAVIPAKIELAKKPRAEATGPHADARRDFCARWKARYNSADEYPFDFGKHGQMLAWMLKQVKDDAARLSTIFARFFDDDDLFYAVESRHSLDKLRQNFQRWQADLPLPAPQHRGHQRFQTPGERITESVMDTVKWAMEQP